MEAGKPFHPRLRELGKTTASYHQAMRRVRHNPTVSHS
jgi:hypothetical protein